jgi:hypothetical protein
MVFAAVGIGIGLDLLRQFYHGQPLSYGLTLFIILLTLVGSFMAFTGIILHSISIVIDQSIKKLEGSGPRKPGTQTFSSGSVRRENSGGTGNPARDN